MTCDSWQDAIALDAGGNLPPAAASGLRRHLQGCAACRRFAEDMAASQRALRRFSERPIDEASLARVRRGVLTGIADGGSSGLRRLPRRSRNATRWLALAAGLLAALLVWRWPAPVDQTGPGVARLPQLEPPEPQSAAPAFSASPPAVPPPTAAPPSDEPRREAEAGTAPRQRDPSPPRRWSLVELTPSPGPLESSPSQVVLPVSSGSLALPSPEERSGSALAPGSAILLDLPSQAASTGTVLRRLAESSDYTIYWLEEPADTLKEKEDAHTKVL